MTLINPTGVTAVSVIAVESVATAALGTRQTLDIRSKWGAFLFSKISRTVAAALTTATPPRIQIRRTYNNDAGIHPEQSYDHVSNVAAALLGTLGATVAISQAQITITGGTSFVSGDIVSMWLSGGVSRYETGEISFKNSATVATLTEPAKVAHASGDLITTMADIKTTWVPLGMYSLKSNNGAGGQTCLFEVLAETYDTDTIT